MGDAESALEKLNEAAKNQRADENSEEKIEREIAEKVFGQIYIPRALDEIARPERDISKIKDGGKQFAYQSVTGVKVEESGKDHPGDESDTDEEEEEDEKESDSEASGDDEEEAEKEGPKGVSCQRPRDESPNSRKERKKLVKAQQAEKRKDKMPKHMKKRKEKAGRGWRGGGGGGEEGDRDMGWREKEEIWERVKGREYN